jgi:hypothetical protein
MNQSAAQTPAHLAAVHAIEVAEAAARTASVSKIYGSGDTRVIAVNEITVQIPRGRSGLPSEDRQREGSPRCAMCQHESSCPSATAPDRTAARVVAAHPEQGWSLLCNGVVLFDDTGELLPDGRIIPPHRPTYASRCTRSRRSSVTCAVWG